MRITNNMIVDRSLMNINTNLGRLDRVQRDISTGKRIHRPSDDPTSMARALVLRQNMAQNEQYGQNIQAAQQFLSLTDSTIGEVTNTMMRLRNLVVQGANGHLRAQDRDAIITEVNQIREELRALGNTQVNGRYIFGGLKTQSEPLPEDVTFGPNDNGKLSVEVGPGLTIDYNVTARELFGDTTPPSTYHLFEVMDEFVGMLSLGNSTPEISGVILSQVDFYMEDIKTKRTEVGGKINRLELANSRLEEINVGLEDLLTKTESTDIPQASLKLNQYEATFQAALSIGARSIPLSLVDFLR